MNCKTCDHRSESPISGTCEGCVNGSKHSDKTRQPTAKNCPIYEAISRKLSGFATVPALERSKMMMRAAKAAKEAAAPRVIELEKRIFELESELEEYASLIKLQHRRSVEAFKLWQKAHNKPGVWPDLGELLAWLMGQIKQKNNALKLALNYVEADAGLNDKYAAKNVEIIKAAIENRGGKNEA